MCLGHAGKRNECKRGKKMEKLVSRLTQDKTNFHRGELCPVFLKAGTSKISQLIS